MPEKKYITIEWRQLKPDLNDIDFWIVDQSHRGSSFGNVTNEFLTFNGFLLASQMYPENHISSKTFYVRGSEYNQDNKRCLAKREDLIKIIEAINEYNTYFGHPEIIHRFGDPELEKITNIPKDLFEI